MGHAQVKDNTVRAHSFRLQLCALHTVPYNFTKSIFAFETHFGISIYFDRRKYSYTFF